MKTKLVTLLALLGLSFNAASAGEGSVSVGYASDYFLRGSLLSGESVQSEVSYGADVSGLNASINAFTNQSVSSGADTYIVSGALSKGIGEIAKVSLGLEHTELVSGDAALNVKLGTSLNTPLSPTLVIEKDLEEDLYTVEISAAHSLDLKVAELGLSALYGNTDATPAQNVDYYILGASLSRPISESASAELGVDYVDSDTIEGESIFSLSVNVKF